jgi:hypothetical protein
MTGLIALQQSAVTQLGRGGGGTVQPSCVDRARGGAATAAQVAAGTVRSMRVGPGLNLCAKRSSGAENFFDLRGYYRRTNITSPKPHRRMDIPSASAAMAMTLHLASGANGIAVPTATDVAKSSAGIVLRRQISSEQVP